MPFRMGEKDIAYTIIEHEKATAFIRVDRQQMAANLREAGKYAVRAATMCGTDMDFDPDALVQNLVVGMLGYFTSTGFSEEEDN